MDGRHVSKVALAPAAPALIGGRGMLELVHRLATRCQVLTFDEIIKIGPGIALEVVADYKMSNPTMPDELIGTTEFYIAGYSDSEKRLVSYFMPCDGRYLFRFQSAFSLQESEAMTAAPHPSEEAILASGFECPQPDDFDPEVHGVALMEAMRATPGDDYGAIGGFLQISTVNANGVSARNFRPSWKNLPTTLKRSDVDAGTGARPIA
jgi:hypothetical protein